MMRPKKFQADYKQNYAPQGKFSPRAVLSTKIPAPRAPASPALSPFFSSFSLACLSFYFIACLSALFIAPPPHPGSPWPSPACPRRPVHAITGAIFFSPSSCLPSLACLQQLASKKSRMFTSMANLRPFLIPVYFSRGLNCRDRSFFQVFSRYCKILCRLEQIRASPRPSKSRFRGNCVSPKPFWHRRQW